MQCFKIAATLPAALNYKGESAAKVENTRPLKLDSRNTATAPNRQYSKKGSDLCILIKADRRRRNYVMLVSWKNIEGCNIHSFLTNVQPQQS